MSNYRLVGCFAVLCLVFLLSTGINTNRSATAHSENLELSRESSVYIANGTWVTRGPVVINNNSDFTIQGWPGNGSASSPFILDYLNITGSLDCISIINTTSHFEIKNCLLYGQGPITIGVLFHNVTNGVIEDTTIDHSGVGIYLVNSSQCMVDSNNITDNSETGINLYYSNWTNVVSNNVSGNGYYGIRMNGARYCNISYNELTTESAPGNEGISIMESDYCYFEANDFPITVLGITLGLSNNIEIIDHDIHNMDVAITATECTNLTFIDCTLRECQWGMRIQDCTSVMIENCDITSNEMNGIELSLCTSLTISHSTLTDNGNGVSVESYGGILLDNSNGIIAENNYISSNTGYGIYIEIGCWNITVFMNHIGWNSAGNAYDEAAPNTFDNSVDIGNWWNDYSGTGNYTIPIGSVDRYPMIWTSPSSANVSSPDDVVYEFGETGNSIEWLLENMDPGIYEIYRNGSLISDSNLTFTMTVILEVDGLDIGVWEYTIVVAEFSHDNLTDTVLVYVEPDTTYPVVSGPEDFSFVEGSVGVTITWTAYDPNPIYYSIYLNESHIAGAVWITPNTTVSISLDGLSVGYYIYRIDFCDSFIHNSTDYVNVTVLPQGYIPHDPIQIWSDSEFHLMATLEGWRGTGTPADPYIIEWLEIITSERGCISIGYVSVTFKIQNCRLNPLDYNGGVTLISVANAEIKNCHIITAYTGINLHDVTNITVFNNTISSDWNGIWLYESFDCIFINNILTGGGLEIWAEASDAWHHTVIDNELNGLGLGYFELQTSQVIDGSLYGQIILIECTNVFVFNGNFSNTDTGITLYECLDCTIDNAVTSWNHRGIFDVLSQGTTIRNCMIFGNEWVGIQLNWTTGCVLEYNSMFNNQYVGLVSFESVNLYMYNNQFSGCLEGAGLYFSHNSWIESNRFYANDEGLRIYQTNNCTVILNKFQNSYETGCTLGWGTSGNVVYANIFSGNNRNALDDGVNNFWDNLAYIGNSWDDYSGPGSYTIPGSASSMDNFPINADTYLGPIQVGNTPDLSFSATTYPKIVLWWILTENQYDIQLIRNGAIIETELFAQYVFFKLEVNEPPGYYEYKFSVVDVNSTSASDTVLVHILEPDALGISSPNDITYDEGTVGNFVLWELISGEPTSYSVYRNDSLLLSGFWEGDAILVNVDFLISGVYNWTILVTDGTQTVTDTVLVIVLNDVTTVTSSSITTTTDVTSSTTTTTVHTTPTVPTSSTTSTTNTTGGYDLTGYMSIIITLGSVTIIVVFSLLICRARNASNWEREMSKYT